jgi:hypothetical protein
MTGPYPPPYPHPGGHPPLPPPPKKSRTGLIVGLILGVLLLLGGGVAAVVLLGEPVASQPTATAAPVPERTSSSAPNASGDYAVGDCVWLDKEYSYKVDCTSPKAALKINSVIAVDAECKGSDGDYWGDDFHTTDPPHRYCLSLVVPEGQCLQEAQSVKAPGYVMRSTCTPTAAQDTMKVVKVAQAANADAACTDKQEAWYFDSPTSGKYACLEKVAG